MLLTILIAALAACGIILVAWAVFEAFLTPLPEHTHHIIYLHGDNAAVEQYIRTALWLRERRGMRGCLYFVDCAMEPETRCSAQQLLSEAEGTVLCTPAQMLDYLEQESREIGSGTH